tara:strand:+ start:902 stop:1480 length:579 start_codon:yes stop_codon:yes gene_type:complete
MKNKVILTDCDGVLLDWERGFDEWMKQQNYDVVSHNCYRMNEKYDIPREHGKFLVRMFNESANMKNLPPLWDAIKYIKKLHEEHGYVFHVITSMTTNVNAQELRTQNLRALFGETAIEKFTYLDCGADKDIALFKYKDSGMYWIEDKPENADLGLTLGLDSLLMSHHHNSDYEGDAKVVNNWLDIYHTIMED